MEPATAQASDGTAVQRQPLSRNLIIERAIEFMDAHGTQHLTMRRLGQQLGVEAMSLYRYVNGREDLLEGVVDRLVDQIRVEPGPEMEPQDGWQASLQWLAHSVRGLALEHPSIFPLIATRHPAAPWLRPPLRSLRIVEEFLTSLTARGFSEAQAVRTYRTFSSFLLGHLLLEVASIGAETSPVEEPVDEGNSSLPGGAQDLDLDGFPTVKRLRPLLSEDHTKEEFEQALEALLDRIDLDLSQ
jgi:TetR/AcrR family transcriptional regulator, tetracycline repressor protein